MQNMATIFKYQNSTGKNPLIFDTYDDRFRFLHCSLSVNNADFTYSYSEFLEIIDERLDMLGIIDQFTQITLDEMIEETDKVSEAEVKKKPAKK